MSTATKSISETEKRSGAKLPLYIDAGRLASDLRKELRGEVRFDHGSRALYATDGSNSRQVPIGVVVPRTIDDVVATVDVCRQHGAPLLSRGAGTSLTGGCCNVAVVIDWSKHLNRVISIDCERKLARVQPGAVCDALRTRAEEFQLTFAPDPSTHNHNTLGGMIGNNSCGVHSLMGLGTGRTSDQVHELEILLYDGTRMTVGATSPDELEAIISHGGRRGEIYRRLKELRDFYAEEIRRRYPRNLPRRVSGYNLDDLLPEKGFHVARALSGTEGTCVTVLEACVHLVKSPAYKSETVKEALDLCLACKGCRTECPMNVDMATYKAEFLSHYYEGKQRPRHAYALGLVYWWARLASLAPSLVNLITHAPVLGKAFQWLGGISCHRSMPWFAPETSKAWWLRRPERNVGRPRVILWADTFNNHFHPQTGRAAVEILEAAGFQVVVPRESLCCGRPLYDFGFLVTAKQMLRQVIDALRPELERGTPLVGLEPSCVAVFRDELVNLFPMDEDAKRLYAQTFVLSEFLETKAPHFRLPRLKRKALVHKHCHHDHVMKFDAESTVLKKLGLDFELLDSGCCGMAGSFGFESSHYDVSVMVGERRLLPAVRQTGLDTLIIADGFSCREQIAGLTGRGALHLAQVIQMALHEGPSGALECRPEDHYQPLGLWQPSTAPAVAALAVGAGILAGAGLVWWLGRGMRDGQLAPARALNHFGS